MRHKNSVSQINKERDKEIESLYKTARSIAGHPATIDRICTIMANLPCRKFYLSDYWALRYAKDRRAGRFKKFSNRHKQTLYNAFYNTVVDLSRTAHYRNKSIESIVYAALERPAPIIGLSPAYLKNVLRYKLNIYQYEKSQS